MSSIAVVGDSNNRREVVVKIDDDDSSTSSRNMEQQQSKIWRGSSYDFWKEDDNNKSSGDTSLVMDLEMAEHRHERNLPPLAESPVKKELFQPVEGAQGVRQNAEFKGEVSFQNKSNLLRLKRTRSRQIDPPEEPEHRAGRVPKSLNNTQDTCYLGISLLNFDVEIAEHHPQQHLDSRSSATVAGDSNNRPEDIVKIGDGDSSTSSRNMEQQSKIWLGSSSDFWKEDDNNVRDGNKDDFRFVQPGQSSSASASPEDPLSNLIGQFLHKQKSSGDMSLDINLEMAELRHERNLPPLAESPAKRRSFSQSKELKVSFDPTTAAAASNDDVEIGLSESVRRRNKDSTEEDSRGGSGRGNGDNEVVRCTSNAEFERELSFQNKSSLLKLKRTKSRLMDTPVEPENGAGRVSKSGHMMRSGHLRSAMLGKWPLDDEDDDLSWEDDLPDECKKANLSALTLLQWLSLIVIIGGFVCTLSIPFLRRKNLWKLNLWKWEVLLLVLICGRLVSGWGVRMVVFFIERNFLLRKRVLYFVYGLRKAVQNCLWLGLVLLAWHLLFDEKVERVTKSDKLKYVTKVLVCLLAGTFVWLVKTLIVKVLASSFHVIKYFDRIQESLFYQYVIETLSGPPLIEIKRTEKEDERLVDEVRKLPNAGATIPPDLKNAAFPTAKSRRVIGSGGLPRSPRRSINFSQPLNQKLDDGITVDHLHKLNPKNVSAWNMKRLMNIVRHGSLTTLDEQIEDSTRGDEKATQIISEVEAKAAAKKIFQNVAGHGSKHIYVQDLTRFLRDDEALRTMSLFEGASESGKISKTSLKNWVVNAFRERRALALTLNDTKTAVNKLHQMVKVMIILLIVVLWLLILGIATTKFLVFVSSQLVLVAFVFGNTCKTVFEAIIFLFVVHPFDVGDRCEIDGVEMVVEEMNILTTVFLRYDNSKIVFPNGVLSTKPINNYYRSPNMGDGVEFCIHVSTPAEKIAAIKHRITSYIENKKEHWCAQPMIVVMNVEGLDRVRFAVWLGHKMNFQDIGERWVRRSLLVEEMMKTFQELDLQYRLFPVDINVCSMPSVTSTRVPSNWTATTS
ncbi:hypothetical protein FEM48_Zijuj09G0162500 [Ziziphus jujuba var. spinosa]|uniref:Mechanosensitive ion channel protein n=1 Tax=Ziziphus jujuba var. spinosa TaxID=714518 RepID=A0A978UU01_ZIZJJ|nr:hypothetical protein FEM48_Zijuj09G0162500 [Ziziphus jujuba var. spinosa]